MADTIDVNLNATVIVTLTQYGADIYNKYYADYEIAKEPKPEGATVSMLLHELALIFGDVLYVGNPKQPFVDNNLKIRKKS